MGIRAGVLVVSDRVSAGLMEDRSGAEAAAALAAFAEVAEIGVVADDFETIRQRLLEWCGKGLDVIFTVGGTGFSPRDVTPEATRSVIEREAAGLITALVVNGLAGTPRAALSRAAAGLRGRTLIVNLPGSRSAVRESISYLSGVLAHAVEMMRGGGHGEKT
jgi:molybdopterin adenylyltransferase